MNLKIFKIFDKLGGKIMRKEFSLSNDKATINFTAKYCDSFEAIMNSEGFRRIVEAYLIKAKSKNTNNFKFLNLYRFYMY